MINTLTEGLAPSGVEMIQTPLKFRPLKANEVELRANSKEPINGKIKVLAYKNARVDMNILDETVGALNWQKEYREAKGMLFCRLGIKDASTGEWIWKSDTGVPSNIDPEKGLASDAFKRAGTNFGIGRELYTLPTLEIPVTEKDFYNGKLCQSFSVSELSVSNGIVTKMTVKDKWGNQRFTYSVDESAFTTVSEVIDDIPQGTTTGAQASTSSIRKASSSLNEKIIAFCDSKKNEAGVNLVQLESFKKFFTKSDRNNPEKSVAECFDYFDIERQWTRWMERARN